MASFDPDDDSVKSADSSGPYDPSIFEEEALEYLKANDPLCNNAFYVTFNGDANPNFGFDPLTIDWEKEGSAIAKYKHLKWLEIRDLEQETDEHYLFCERNRVE